MSLADIKDLIILVSSVVGIAATTIGILLSLKDYRLKLQAEIRLSESTTAETDIRLLQLFTEILGIASGRKGDAVFSKEILDQLIQRGLLTDEDFKNIDNLKSKISQAAMIAQTPGVESANAAFASIATLAKQHPVLYEPAIEALETCRRWNPQLSEKYLKAIRENRGKETKRCISLKNKAG